MIVSTRKLTAQSGKEDPLHRNSGAWPLPILALKLFAPDIEDRCRAPFDKIIPAVVSGSEFDAGLIIHEGQLSTPTTAS